MIELNKLVSDSSSVRADYRRRFEFICVYLAVPGNSRGLDGTSARASRLEIKTLLISVWNVSCIYTSSVWVITIKIKAAELAVVQISRG